MPHRDMPDSPGTARPASHFAADGRALAAPLLACDWSASSLGPPASWPQPLRAAVSLMLDSPVPMWLAWGPALGMVYNMPYAAMLGTKHPQALGAPLQQVWSEIWADVADAVSQALAGQALYHEDLQLRVRRGNPQPDGAPDEEAWFSFSYLPLRAADGVVRGLICTVWETTAKMLAQRRLRHSESRLHALTWASTQIIYRVDPDWRQLLELHGRGFVADAAQPVTDWRARYVHPDDRPLVEAAIQDAMRTGADYDCEHRVLRAGGGVGWVHSRAIPVRDDAGRLLEWFGTATDTSRQHEAQQALLHANVALERRVAEEVAERVRTEQVLRQTQKMEAVGQLSGGIAHDFNNMLAVVIGSLDLLTKRFTQGDADAQRHVDAARDSARRAAQLTQRLLAFSRQQPLQPEPLDANRLVAGMADLLRRALGSAVQLETAPAPGLWHTHADPNQLENALLNLAVNGRDAMADGGHLRIATANRAMDLRAAAARPGLAVGDYVLISVRDTGAGMPPEVLARAFNPFFTTKEVGRGTGLGLSQVYGFVKQSGGYVHIDSRVGAGTVVEVLLPRLAAPQPAPEPPAPEPVPAAVPVAACVTVLVVEDEAAVRRFSVEALQELGYGVLEADGAAAALRLLDAHPEIALLFTDVVMPEVNGRKLADQALQRRPDLKVLFTTGYTRNVMVQDGVLEPDVELLAKPYSLDDLAARVSEVLAMPQRRAQAPA